MTAAVIGTGHIAHQHLECLQQLAGVETVAVCDLSPATAAATADRFCVPRHFCDHRELLRDVHVDVVHVTTPVQSHASICRDALQQGAHVIVEKPLAMDMEEAESLIQLAEANDRWIVEDFNYLFNPEFAAILQRIETRNNDATENSQPHPTCCVVHVDVQLFLDMKTAGGGVAGIRNSKEVVRDFLPHLASITRRLLGPIERVHVDWPTVTGSTGIEFRASVASKTATANLVFSSRAQPDMFQVRVQTERFSAECQLFEPYLHFDVRHSGARPLIPLRNGLAKSRAARGSALRGLWRKLAGRPGAYEGLWKLIAGTYQAVSALSSPHQVGALNAPSAPVSHGLIRDTNELVHRILETSTVHNARWLAKRRTYSTDDRTEFRIGAT